MLLQILVLLFGVFAISRSYLRYKDRLLTLANALFWGTLWALMAAAVFFKEWTSVISSFMGVERGVDFMLFAVVIFLSYLCFRLYVKLEEIRQDMTKLVRRLALKEQEYLGGISQPAILKDSDVSAQKKHIDQSAPDL